MSRRADCAEDVERDNKNQVMLKKEWLEIRVMEKEHILIERAEEEIIKKLKAKDNEIVKVVKEVKKLELKY